MFFKKLLMPGLEPGSFGVGRERSATFQLIPRSFRATVDNKT